MPTVVYLGLAICVCIRLQFNDHAPDTVHWAPTTLNKAISAKSYELCQMYHVSKIYALIVLTASALYNAAIIRQSIIPEATTQ